MTDAAGCYSFESILPQLRGGRKVTRKGWSGKGMFIYLVPPEVRGVSSSDRETYKLVGIYAEGIEVDMASRIDMRYANGMIGTWTATHEDLLSRDWQILI